MSDVVVVRPLIGLFTVKCPLCNTEKNIDKSGNIAETALEYCEGCGALFNFQLLAIQPLNKSLNSDTYSDNDITMMMAKNKSNDSPFEEYDSSKDTKNIVGTQKLTIQKSAFYVGEVTCPFCNEKCIVAYNAPTPFVAQWCPVETCKAELVVTIWVLQNVGGNLTDWYKKESEDKVPN